MAKYCANCGKQIIQNDKYCKYCGTVVQGEIKKDTDTCEMQNFQTEEKLYEFFVEKATFRFMSTKIYTSVTIKNNILSTAMRCKSNILSKKKLNGQINISDISSIGYKQYATVAWYDMFLFALTIFLMALDITYAVPYAFLAGVFLWRTLVPTLEIKTKDKRCLNILFSPRENTKDMLNLVSEITGKEVDETSDIHIPFSKKPFVAGLIAAIIGFIIWIFMPQ